MESHGFIKKNEVSQMRELNKKTLPGKRSSLSEENPLRNAFMNYTGENMI